MSASVVDDAGRAELGGQGKGLSFRPVSGNASRAVKDAQPLPPLFPGSTLRAGQIMRYLNPTIHVSRS